MTFTKKFTIAKNGVLRGGTAQYTVDSVTGKIDYQVDARVGMFITFPFSKKDSYTLSDPSVLKPQAVDTVGKVVTLGAAVFKVLSANAVTSLVAITITQPPQAKKPRRRLLGLLKADAPMTGTAMLATGTREVFEVNFLKAKATVSGFNLTIDCEPA